MSALSTVKVLDLSRLLPGPYATLVLADLGATVDKIEDMAGGDYLRNMPPLAAPSSEPTPRSGGFFESTSSAFLALNRSKRSALVDLKHPDGRALFLRLTKHYDVLVDSFRPGVLERLGLSYDVLREANERLIVCAITGYGQTGPRAGRAGHDLNFLARSGLLGLQGPSEGPPAVPGAQLADVGASLFAVIGILSALLERSVTGRGRVVDVALVEAAAPFGILGLSAALNAQARPRGEDLLTGGLAAYGTYATSDGGAVALASLEPKFWASFCEGIGRSVTLEDLIPGPHQAALASELTRIFASKPLEAWRAFAEERDCCLEPVLTPTEARADTHLRARGFFFEAPSPWGIVGHMRTPTAAREVVPLAPPRRGEHTTAILIDAGFTESEVSELRARGAIA